MQSRFRKEHTGNIFTSNDGLREITPGRRMSLGKLNSFLLIISYAVETTLSIDEAYASGLVALSLASASKCESFTKK
jgi:hypothetical protein